MKYPVFAAAIIVSVILAGTIGFAQDPDQVSVETRIQKEIEVVNEKGEPEIRLVEAGNAVPGDELLFTVTYTNRGAEKAENIVLVNPVPEHTEYIGDSAGGEGTAISYSIDGGVSYDLPGNLKVVDQDRQRTALPREYTHIRWKRPGILSPSETGTVFFRVRLQ